MVESQGASPGTPEVMVPCNPPTPQNEAKGSLPWHARVAIQRHGLLFIWLKSPRCGDYMVCACHAEWSDSIADPYIHQYPGYDCWRGCLWQLSTSHGDPGNQSGTDLLWLLSRPNGCQCELADANVLWKWKLVRHQRQRQF